MTEIKEQLKDMQEQLDDMQEMLEKITEDKVVRDKPLNFWEFLLRVEWITLVGVVMFMCHFLKK